MDIEEYVNFNISLRTLLKEKLQEGVGSECEVLTHYIQSGMQSEDDWLANLRKENSDDIRMLVILVKDLTSSSLQRTAGMKNFKPIVQYSLELIHDFPSGKGEESYVDFLKDLFRAQFVLETNKRLGENTNNCIIESYSLRPGIRPSKIQVLHYARGEVELNFSEIRY